MKATYLKRLNDIQQEIAPPYELPLFIGCQNEDGSFSAHGKTWTAEEIAEIERTRNTAPGVPKTIGFVIGEEFDGI